MRKLVLILLFLSLPSSAITVRVNQKTLPNSPGAKIEQGRVLLPLRAVFEALGAQVNYQNSTIRASRGHRNLVLRPNQSQASVNGKLLTLDVPAQLVNGVTYVPIRFVAESLGEPVKWQASERTVLVGKGSAGVQAAANQGASKMKAKLARLVVGNQGGILKVRKANLTGTVYYRGLDDRNVAPFSKEDQREILSHLSLSNERLENAVNDILSNYSQLPQRESLAFLGLLASLEPGELSPVTRQKLMSFLRQRMMEDPSVYNRRQATLALAVSSTLERATLDSVMTFYQGSENLWETFPVQQFFEYHAERVKAQPDFLAIREQLELVNSLYRENILSYL